MPHLPLQLSAPRPPLGFCDSSCTLHLQSEAMARPAWRPLRLPSSTAHAVPSRLSSLEHRSHPFSVPAGSRLPTPCSPPAAGELENLDGSRLPLTHLWSFPACTEGPQVLAKADQPWDMMLPLGFSLTSSPPASPSWTRYFCCLRSPFVRCSPHRSVPSFSFLLKCLPFREVLSDHLHKMALLATLPFSP